MQNLHSKRQCWILYIPPTALCKIEEPALQAFHPPSALHKIIILEQFKEFEGSFWVTFFSDKDIPGSNSLDNHEENFSALYTVFDTRIVLHYYDYLQILQELLSVWDSILNYLICYSLELQQHLVDEHLCSNYKHVW